VASDGEHDRSGEERAVDHDRRTVWTTWTIICIGVWVAVAPAMLGYGERASWVNPSGGRGPWFGDATHTAFRAQLMTWSDVVAGVLLVTVGVAALRPARPIPRWGLCLIGIWLVFAPVVMWSPVAVGYVNDSLAGILVIGLAVLVPGMPNMPKYMMMGGATPPGWTYNPSSWAQRSVLIALALGGLVVSRYLAAYQLGYVHQLWDPFFGFHGNTQPVLDSPLSHQWPVSDAALGGIAYTFEFLMGWMGGTARWRTMPWMVTIFGILVIPLGLAHVALVMSQPVVVHHWCTFCLLAAAFMLPMVPLEIDEVVAMCQHVRDSRRRGDRGGSVWRIFWLGGSAEGASDGYHSPAAGELTVQPSASVWGFSSPLSLLLTAVGGVWFLVLPAVFSMDIHSSAADVAHLGGAFILTASIVAMGEVVRVLRWANVAAGLCIVALSPIVSGASFVERAALAGSAIIVAALSVPRGPVTQRYGTWQPAIR
jgi:hypothetical protein